jgi:hypothetical protein
MAKERQMAKGVLLISGTNRQLHVFHSEFHMGKGL